MPLHPQAQAFLEMLAAQNAPSWDEIPPAEGREIFASLTAIFGEGPKLDQVEDRIVADVPVRLYRPSSSRSLPVVIYFHGGGWVLGNLETHDALCRRLAAESEAAVIAVDYRLAPEAKYPAAFDDCYAVTEFVGQHPDQFGVDARRLAVAGDGAGGNLATAVALKARDQQTPKITTQVLIYPVIEQNFDSNSYVDFATDYGLTRQTMRWFWDQYVAESTAERNYVDVSEADLTGLPPAYVITAEYDVLRDEGERYANLLAASGVPTTSRRYDGMLHGFVHFTGFFDDGLTATKEVARMLKATLQS